MKNKRLIAKEARKILKILWEQVEVEDEYENAYEFMVNLSKKNKRKTKRLGPSTPK